MQRLYAMFPAGRAGLGLLLLRVVVALQLIAVGNICSQPLARSLTSWLAQVVAMLLCVGALTPLLALLAACMAVWSLLSHWSILQPLVAVYGLIIANGLVLALLGPGAYALDARWFGRRLMVVRAAGRGADPADEVPDEAL